MPPLSVGEMAVLAVGAASCVTDLRSRRIPNALTIGAAAGAIAFGAASGGLMGVMSSAGGWVVGCLLFLPWFVLGGMGAGDVKLLAAMGAWVGPGDAVWIALYAAVAGGIFAVIVTLAAGYFGEMVRNLWMLLMFWRVTGVQPHPDMTLRTGRGPRLPYAIPILAGAVAELWLR